MLALKPVREVSSFQGQGFRQLSPLGTALKLTLDKVDACRPTSYPGVIVGGPFHDNPAARDRSARCGRLGRRWPRNLTKDVSKFVGVNIYSYLPIDFSYDAAA